MTHADVLVPLLKLQSFVPKREVRRRLRQTEPYESGKYSVSQDMEDLHDHEILIDTLDIYGCRPNMLCLHTAEHFYATVTAHPHDESAVEAARQRLAVACLNAGLTGDTLIELP